MAFSNLVSLGGVEFTDQGRTFDEVWDERRVENELANGAKRRYKKASKRRFTLSWDWLPNSASQTYDGKAGRDSLRSLVYSGTELTFIYRNQSGSDETYTVFVESYSETLLRRDSFINASFYTVNLELVEV
jgi:hypothetical protein